MNPDPKLNRNSYLTEEIIKSENDSMEYRLVYLDNGLTALLVSDVQKIINLEDFSEEEGEEEEENEEEEEDGEGVKEGEKTGKEEFKPKEAKHERIIGSMHTPSANTLNDDSVHEEDDSDQPFVRHAEEKMAACALCIGVGSFSDPPDIPGLAHFVEHMVFMGSSKYPQENGFDEFIKKNGGSDNGSTDCETTTFYLECNEKYLKEGMDRFAQFFISPLMNPEAMGREREIIHSEFEMSLPSDGTRREQILGTFAPENHPAAKFLWGNLTTLKKNVEDRILYKKVHEFQKKHYSAHRMTLAVQARLSLDILEDYVRTSFANIPSNNLPPDDFSAFLGSFGNPNSFNKLVWIKPVKDICQVHLTWVLPSYMKEYKSRPLDYVGWLIGHEGEGSLLSYLRTKVWALQCEAGNDESGFELNSIYSLFSVSLTLTEEGFEHLNEAIGLIFSYLNMLNTHAPNKEIYEELHTICETNFRYKTEIPAANYVEILAESMHIYEPKHYIAGGELYLEYKPNLISEVLSLLTPDKVNVMVYSTDKADTFYDRVEPWFHTKYKVEDIDSNVKKSWLNSKAIEEFHIPKPNQYLTDDFSLIQQPINNPPYPVKIEENDLIEIWYRQDVKFKQPLAYYSFYMLSPIIKTSAVNAVLLDVLSAYLETKLTEQVFTANQAGLYCTYSPADLGLCLQFSGYNQKLPLLFDEILRLINKICGEIHIESNIKIFDAIKKDISRSYYNKFLKPRKLVKMARLSILMDNFWTSIDRYNVIKDLSVLDLEEFSKKFFSSVRILGLIQGNVSKEKSLELCSKFKTILQCSPLQGPKPRILVTKLNNGQLILRVKSFSEFDSNSVVTNYYQIGPGSIRTSCLIDLLMMLMDEPLFDNLRTKQQIGYDVHCLLRDTFGIVAFSVTVFYQANKFLPNEVDDRIEKFLKSFLKNLKSMSKKEWEETKTSLCMLKNSADLQLQDEVKRNFGEICSSEYIFDRLQKEIETIPKITHKELCQWFSELIASGRKFKKLSVQIVGDTRSSEDSSVLNKASGERSYALHILSNEAEKNSLFVKDIVDFKNKRQFYPAKEES